MKRKENLVPCVTNQHPMKPQGAGLRF